MDLLLFTLILIIYFTSVAVGLFLYYDHRKTLKIQNQLNNEAVMSNITSQIESFNDTINKFDERINKTWETISSTKQTVDSLKLQFELKSNRL